MICLIKPVVDRHSQLMTTILTLSYLIFNLPALEKLILILMCMPLNLFCNIILMFQY